MFEKLKAAEQKYIGIEDSLGDPGVMSDPKRYGELMKEYKYLAPIIGRYRDYKETSETIEDLKILAETDTDPELKKLAEDELGEYIELRDKVLEELKILLLPKDPNDDKNVIVEIRACAGGEEAALFAADLYRMYGMYADKNGIKISPMSSNPTEIGGYREITFMMEGEGVYAKMKFESGVHRVQRVPNTETQGRIHTSTVSVAVLPEAEDVEIEINPSELKFETCKSSGAGGQHINKTESAVRITHLPSGIIVECQEERSQFKNRDKALKMLRAKLFDIKQREQDDKIASERREQVGTGDRSEKIRTYNFPQSRITDHRIKLTTHALESFLNGDIGEMIDALRAADAAGRLKGNDSHL